MHPYDTVVRVSEDVLDALRRRVLERASRAILQLLLRVLGDG